MISLKKNTYSFKSVILFLCTIFILYLFIDGVHFYPIKNIEENNSKLIYQNNFNSYENKLTNQSGNTIIYGFNKDNKVLFLAYLKSNIFNSYKLNSQFITTNNPSIDTVVEEQFFHKLVHISHEEISIVNAGPSNTLKILFYIFLFKLLLFIIKKFLF